jgi:hypothetical protein
MGGELRLFRIVLRLRGTKNNFKIGQIFYIFKISYEPFTFAKNSFFQIQSINSNRDGFMCQYWTKMSKIIFFA